MFTFITALFFSCLLDFSLAQGPTRIYIDALAAYDSLATCPQSQLNTIVKNQAFGCGNANGESGNPYTSFTCFCSSSSDRFNTVISDAVTNNCASNSGNITAAVSSALDVFRSYCAQGTSLTMTNSSTSTTSFTQSPTPAATASTTFATSTTSPLSSTTPTASTQSDSLSGGETAGAVIGSVFGAGLIIGGIWLLIRRKLNRTAGAANVTTTPPHTPPSELDSTTGVNEMSTTQCINEMDATREQRRVAEMEATKQLTVPVEVSAELRPPVELPVRD